MHIPRIHRFRHVLVFAVALMSGPTFAQTLIEHSALAYFVPGKRIAVDARVSDPKGVKVARTYFRAGAQAGYTYVPMQYTSGNRYVAVLPAPSASTPAIEYLVLAQSNDGAVSRTQTYSMPARQSGDAPSWQSTSASGDIKVYTELANAPRAVAGFTDSITLDVAESGARLGAAAGLYGGASGGTAGSASASTGSSATTATTVSTTTATAAGATAATTAAATTTAAAAAGGLSTAAIIGGVVVAGAAAAAAGGGGGGGGGSSSTPPPATGSPFAGTWTGTVVGNETFTCSGAGPIPSTTTCNSTQPFTATVSPTGALTLVVGTGTDVCNGVAQSLPGVTLTGLTVSSAGTATVVPPVQSGGTVDVCAPITITFTLSPRSLSGTGTCTVQSNTPGITCTGSGTNTINGS